MEESVTKAADRSSLKLGREDLTVHLIEDRRSEISPWGRGNSKIGPGVYTYSKLPGRVGGACPGSTAECELICYAKRVIFNAPVWELWKSNTLRGDELPPLPKDATIVRFHVSGDFDSARYIVNWCKLVFRSPEVRFFGYTRSWRVPELVPWLETLRDYPNVQLFASVDKTTDELPPEGWRRAWLEHDLRAIASKGGRAKEGLKFFLDEGIQNFHTVDDQPSYVCPEETGGKKDCVSCRYCIDGQRGDVIFLEH